MMDPDAVSASASDESFMRLALQQAQAAGAAGEVPVGAVVVLRGQVIAAGRNAPVGRHDPTAHAEMVALREAALMVGNYRLDDCELYVTLEPCAMCSGAMLHARLKRVVFGALESKTGAAGSVINLFAQARLNHHTTVRGGVLAADCAALMSHFFSQRRVEKRVARTLDRLLDDALRPPDSAFDGLPDYPWPAHYCHDLPALGGLRMHYLDESPSRAGLGAATADQFTYLCLHGQSSWSYLYRKMIPVFLEAGHHVVAPDLIGFGKSDKPKKESFHSFSLHRQILMQWIDRLDLQNIILVVQDWGGPLGFTLPVAAPHRYRGLLFMSTLLGTGDDAQMSAAERAAYNAPFPDSGHRAALRAFATLLPQSLDGDASEVFRQALDFWRERWTGQTLMTIGAQDPLLGLPGMRDMHSVIRGRGGPLILNDTAHFVPDHGDSVARQALGYFRR